MKYTLTLGALFFLAACGSSSKESNAVLTEKKAELQKLKDQEKKLEEEIAKLDTSKVEKPKLVAVAAIAPASFTHYIDLQGKVESDNIGYVAPRNGGGQVRAIYVKRGDMVHKGQTLLRLDDATARQAVAAAEQQVTGLRAQAAFTKNIYQKQKNLWDQNIGTEVQVIKAKTDVETTEAQLQSVEEQLKQAKDQLSFANVVSDIDGQVEIMNVRVGEFYSPATASSQLQIVNTSNLKVTAQVPENYIGRVRAGSNVKVNLPDANKTVDVKVRVAGTSIDPNTHGFFIESKLPADKAFRPNQVAMIKIQDYTINDAITIPVNTLQNDEKGKYVMVAVQENGKLIARKKAVVTGEFYGDTMEIKSGLKSGDQIIVDGFQSLYDGQLLTTDTK